MTRATNGEKVKAKMLARNFSSSQNVRVPLLSALRMRTTLLFDDLVTYFTGKRECPKCSDRPILLCSLCNNTFKVNAEQYEAWRYGRALREWRVHHDLSLRDVYETTGVQPHHVSRHEEGSIPLAEWPSALIQRAEMFLPRE